MTEELPPADLDALEAERREEEKRLRADLSRTFAAFGHVVMPTDAEPPILSPLVRSVLRDWMTEIDSARLLKKVKLKPRSRMMLSGPPGCGKTTLAHHVAARKGYPLIVIQAHVLLSKWVNESGEKIGRLFREARKVETPIALFFDEFDAVARPREDMGGSGAEMERSSITISFLQELDRFDGLVFAATNVPKGIDAAVWRRFQIQLEIGLPGDVERDAITRLYFDPFTLDDRTARFFADAFEGASPALIRESVEFLKRSLVLGDRLDLSLDLLSLLRRMTTAIKPSEGVTQPRLWADRSRFVGDAVECPWPPTRRS